MPKDANASPGHANQANLPDAAGSLAALFQILLVIVLGKVVLGSGNDLRHDWLPKAPALIQSFFRSDGRGPLFGRVKEDDRAILLSDVWPLTIERCGVVVLPEDIQQRVVRDPLRIELHLHRFGVPCGSGADVAIRRVLQLSAGIANAS